jgi:hypothetical protein
MQQMALSLTPQKKRYASLSLTKLNHNPPQRHIISQTITLKNMLDRLCNSTLSDMTDFSHNEFAWLLGYHGVEFTLIEGHYQTFERLSL